MEFIHVIYVGYIYRYYFNIIILNIYNIIFNGLKYNKDSWAMETVRRWT